MKINIKVWVGIIILSAIVIFSRGFSSQPGKKFLFDRTFVKNSIARIDNPTVAGLDVTSITTDSITCSYIQISNANGTSLYDVRYYDNINFALVDSFQLRLPQTAQIKNCTPGQVYYIDRFNLYLYDLAENSHEKISPANFKCLNIASVKPNTLLLFGEDSVGPIFRSGYFTLDLASGSIAPSKIIEENAFTSAAPNSLIYSGKFTRVGKNSMSYYCDKYSRIFFFDNNGKFVREFITRDKTPKPQLVQNNVAFYYKRGSTFNVNNGIHVENDKLLTFSCRSEPVSYMIIDIYSLESGKYLSSTKLHNKDWNCPDVISVSNAGKNTIINFQKGVALFDLSSVTQL
jgi:hypothetical protein